MARKVPDPRVAWIQYLLAKKGHTQDDVAKEAGVHKSTLSLFIAGERPNAESGEAILRALFKLTGKKRREELFPDPLP